MTFAKELVYQTWTEIERETHENRKINANLTWIEITTPTTSYCLWLVGETKCRRAKQSTLRFTNKFQHSISHHHTCRRRNVLSPRPKHHGCNHAPFPPKHVGLQSPILTICAQNKPNNTLRLLLIRTMHWIANVNGLIYTVLSQELNRFCLIFNCITSKELVLDCSHCFDDCLV